MTISALILAKNEEKMIEDCLKQLKFANEVIVLDQNSHDKTAQIASRYADKIITSNFEDFDKNRNLLASEAKSDWLLYVDADERLTPELSAEIRSRIRENHFSAFYFPRKNIILGKWLKHGGWWPDYVPRLFKKNKFIAWTGRVHESPKIQGDFDYLKTAVEHLTARNLSSMLRKTSKWAKVEAELFYETSHSPVTILRVVKSILTEFFIRYFAKAGILDGQVGLIEAIYQALHKSIVLTYLWEIQNDANRKLKTISY